jgi:hypothetical protein
MSELNENPPDAAENPERNRHHEASGSMRHHAPLRKTLAELELENSRLHRLVAELLLKNQQLRKPD